MIFVANTRHKNKLLKEQYNDHLTGLPNRVKLLHDINSSECPVLCIIDINNFKVINNLYGLKIGIARFFNVYGPREPEKGEYATVVRKFIRQ